MISASKEDFFPLLSNVSIDYVFNLLINHQRKTRRVSGDVIVVRWADDFVIGFHSRTAAERYLVELKNDSRRSVSRRTRK